MAVDDGQAVCIIHRKRCDGAFRPGKFQIAGDGSRIRTQVFIAEPDKLRTSGASRCRQQEGCLLYTSIQHNQGQNPDDFDYEFNLSYGKQYFETNPLLKEMKREIDNDTLKHIQPL